MERRRLSESAGGDYFPGADRNIQFVRSGCTLLDCVLGGGWPLGRVSNIVGDKAVGKSLLAIEAAANFARQYPQGRIWYREAEAAFDEDYAVRLGLPLDRVDFGPDGIETSWNTIESIFNDLFACIKASAETGEPGLYVVDSLDALSSEAEMAREVGEGSFGLEKQQMLGQLFRGLIRPLKQSKVGLLIVSQVREKIGFVVGEKYTRSGGKALDFYSSIIIMMSHIKTITRQVGGAKRAVAVQTKTKATKNKITTPFRECLFTIRFGYGIDDFVGNMDWLEEVKRVGDLGIAVKEVDKYIAATEALPDDAYRAELERVRNVVGRAWTEIEAGFAPARSKY